MGINIARGVNVMREALSEAGLVPLELMAVAQEQAGHGTVFGVGPAELAGVVETLRGQGLTIPLDKPHADVMLVSTVIDVLLFQEALAATARILNHLKIDWILRSAGFEAANFGLLSGNESLQRTASQKAIDEALAIGAKTVILPECGHAYLPDQPCRTAAAQGLADQAGPGQGHRRRHPGVMSCASCRLNFIAGEAEEPSRLNIEGLIELVAAQLP